MQNGTQIALARPRVVAAKPTRRRSHRASRPQLLDRSQLDGRTNAARIYDRLVTNIESDLAGRDHLSTVKRALVEAFAGAYVTVNNLNARMLLGQAIDLGQHAQAVSAMVRVASRLGIERQARDVSPPSVEAYLAHVNAQREAAE